MPEAGPAGGEACGLEVSLADLVGAVSEAMDFMSPEVVGHHRRVAFVTRAIARQAGLSGDDTRDVVLAAALHDSGAFSLSERLAILDFETRRPHEHAEAGYRLLRAVPDLRRAALLVRYHHVPWGDGRGREWKGGSVPLGSQILHLADRVSVLVRPAGGPGTRASAILRLVASCAGALFVPELVEAFAEAAARPGFWEEAADPAWPDRGELFGCALVSEADLIGLVGLFGHFVDFRSRFTATHTSGVVAVAERLSGLCGLDAAEAGKLSVAAAVHDLGKLSVPAEILEKPGPLSDAEWVVMRRHPSCGFDVLGKLPALGQVNAWANFHHERLNGRGYPFRLTAERIPLGSRIVAVADVFTALTEDRPYRAGVGGAQTIDILRGMAREGSLDPEIVGIAAGNGEALDSARRSAQARAGARYGEFLEPAGAAAGEAWGGPG